MKKSFKAVFSVVLVAALLLSSLPVFTASAASNEETIYNFLKNEMGLNTAAACGVLANIEKESNFRHDVIEYGYKWENGGGYGICQWTNSPRTSATGRRTNLVNWCNNNGYDYKSLIGQLHYLKYELNTSYYYNLVTKKLLSVDNSASGAYTAGYYWCYYFEVPAGYNTGVSETRGNIAKTTYWNKYNQNVTTNLEINNAYSGLVPITAYLKGSSTVYPYNSDCTTLTGGQIWAEDECVINAVYTNGWCQVTYPTSSGSRTAYTPLSNFMDGSLTRKTALTTMTTYRRADGATKIGLISAGDVCYVTGSSGAYTQAIYPISGGYKLGWALSSDWNYQAPAADNRYNPYCPIKGYILSADTRQSTYESDKSTYAGQLFVDDYCTINAVYSDGWCQVTYPVGTSTKTQYVPLSAFVHNTSYNPVSYNVTAQVNVYTKSDMTNTPNWWISPGDTFFVIGESGAVVQILYPIDAQYGGGYKIGWIYASDIPKTTYTVSYNANGGSGAPASQIKTHNVALTLNTDIPYKDGYTFAGWATSSSATTANYMAGATYDSNASVTLYAVWTPNKYTVTYNLNGGSGSISDQTKIHGTSLSLTNDAPYREYKISYVIGFDGIECPPRTVCCEFLGWSTSPTATTATYYSGSSFDVNADTTLYAVWSNPVLGELQNYVRDGYVMTGWFTDAVGGTQVTETTVISSDVVLYAHWEANSITSIQVKQLPAKSSYVVGDMFDTEGLILLAHYSDGTSQTITSGFTCYPKTMETSGTQEISVNYAGKTTSFDVTVKEPENIPMPVFVVSDVKTKAGKTVDVTVNIQNNPGIMAAKINVFYDTSVLTLKNVTNGSLMGESLFDQGGDISAVPYTVCWNDTSNNFTDDGVLVTYTFEVNENAPIGTTSVSLTYDSGSTFNYDLENVEFSTIDGTMEIINRTPGDANNDDEVDLKDVVVMRRWLSGGWTVTIDDSNADINCDTMVDLKDVVILRRYLSGGWGIDLDSFSPTDKEPESDKVEVEQFVYGTSENGRELVCYSFTPKNYNRTVLLNFAIHGFEDDYAHDGQVLVDAANELIEYYREYNEFNDCRVLIVPCSNPDGLLDGTTNNGFGRCNASGIDLNRDFDANYSANTTPGRNYTPYAFSAAESRALRDLCYEYNPDVVCDFHGWLNCTIGDSELAEVFYQELNLPHQTSFTSTNAKGYFANWAHQQGALGILVEFKNTQFSIDSLKSAVNRLISGDYENGQGEYTIDEKYSPFSGGIGCYTVSTGRTTTYQGFDIPFETISYIEGTTDYCEIEKIYANGWVKVTYPISSGNKTAYCKLSDFITEGTEVEHYDANVSTKTYVYRRSDLAETIGSVWSTDTFTVIAQNGDKLQIIYPVDEGGWKMGWMSNNSI